MEEGPNYNSMSQEALMSADHVYDIFTEYEKMFDMSRMRQQPQKWKKQSLFALHCGDSIHNSLLNNPLKEQVCIEDLKDDGAVFIGSFTKVLSGSLSASHPADTENHGRLRPVREGEQQERSVKSTSGLEHSLMSTGDFNQGNF